MSKRVTVHDLKQQSGIEERDGKLFAVPLPFLYCPTCEARYSADKGDYWNLDPAYVFRCCRRNMMLAREDCRVREVRP